MRNHKIGKSSFYNIYSQVWNLSSAGRASALQAEGHRFEPCRFHSEIFLKCRRGGTGRRTGLKILRDLYSRTGSIPVAGIEYLMSSNEMRTNLVRKPIRALNERSEFSGRIATDFQCESLILNEYVCVAQLDRALGYGPRCRGFESSHARTKKAEV